MSIASHMTEQEAREWASRRWGCKAVTESQAHPTSFGDMIATITVEDRRGQQFRGYGYSGMAPWGVSMWSKAAEDLARWEPQANVERCAHESVTTPDGNGAYCRLCGETVA